MQILQPEKKWAAWLDAVWDVALGDPRHSSFFIPPELVPLKTLTRRARWLLDHVNLWSFWFKTWKSAYLMEVTVYFAEVKFGINTGYYFLQETLKKIQWCWTSDTCQLSWLSWCWRWFGFQGIESVKSWVAFLKSNSTQSRKHQKNYLGKG